MNNRKITAVQQRKVAENFRNVKEIFHKQLVLNFSSRAP
jgi:hypothetical protein